MGGTHPVFCVILFGAGCGSTERTRFQQTSLSTVTTLQLQEKLKDFSERYYVTLTAASNEIVDSTQDPKIRKNTLYWKIITVPHVMRSISQQTPLAGLLDVWAFCVQSRLLFESPDGRVFGEWTPVALEATRALEADIEDVAHVVLPDDSFFDDAKTAVAAFAEQHPLRGLFARHSARPALVRASDASSLQWVTSMPLKPFRLFMDEHARAIRETGVVADRFTSIVRAMPEIMRWQLELLLYDIEERQIFVSTVRSFDRVSKSAERMASTAEKLPEELKTQLTAVIDDIDSKQGGLQKTLKETQNTLDKLQSTIASAKELTASVAQSSANIVEAGDKWHTAVQAVDTMIQRFQGDPEEEKTNHSAEPAEEEVAFDIRDYTKTAERTEAAAAEVRALTADVHELLESDAVGLAAWKITWCGVVLIVLFFASLLVYRLVASRLAPKRS